jgi:hypothetical protein
MLGLGKRLTLPPHKNQLGVKCYKGQYICKASYLRLLPLRIAWEEITASVCGKQTTIVLHCVISEGMDGTCIKIWL